MKPKLKQCRNCKQEFMQYNSLMVVCSIPCSIELVRDNKKKTNDKKYKELRAKHYKTDIPKLKKRAQYNCNKYIRLRDAKRNCISCDKPFSSINGIQAGHYKSVGSNSMLRYSEFNIWGQCVACNGHLSGNIGLYRNNLVKAIGLHHVEYLDAQNGAYKYSADELLEINKYYLDKIKTLN